MAVSCAFRDDDGAAVVPSSVKWSLMQRDRSVINSRQSVVISPATTVTIVLSGDDLALQSTSDVGARVLTVYAEYSSTLGTDLPLLDEAYFDITDLIGVPEHT